MYAYHTHNRDITMHGRAQIQIQMGGRLCVWVCVWGTFCTLILARQIILALIFITHSDTFQNYAQTNWASDRQTSYKCKCCQLIQRVWCWGFGVLGFGFGDRVPNPTTENEMNEYEKPQTDNKINAKCGECGRSRTNYQHHWSSSGRQHQLGH